MALGHWLKDYIGPHSGGSGGDSGGGADPLLVTLSADDETLDHTWQEIYDVVMRGGTVYLRYAELTIYAFAQIGKSETIYYVRFMDYDDGSPRYLNYRTNNRYDYPRSMA